MLIKGKKVVLYEKNKVGEDKTGRDIYEEIPTLVENVLIAPSSTTDVIDSTSLDGKKAVYVLGIPKGDEHNWEDRTVEFYGVKWHTFGFTTEGMDELIPLDWNKKVMVERYG